MVNEYSHLVSGAFPSAVALRTPAAAVTEVLVLDHRETSGEECVHYDHAIVFTRSDGYRFAFSAERSLQTDAAARRG